MPGTGTGQTNLIYGQATGAAQYWVKKDDQVGLDPSSNMFAPEKWSTQVNQVPEYSDYAPTSTSFGYNGQDIYFDLDKRSTYTGRMELHYLRGAITGYAGTTGTYARFHDWEGYSCIDRVMVEYMNKEILTMRGDELQIYAFTAKNTDWRTREAHLQHGQLTEHQRNVLGTGAEAAATGIWTVVDLQMPWAQARKEIPIYCLPNKIRIHIYFKNLVQCIQSDGNGTPACSITNMLMRVHMDHVPDNVQKALDMQIRSQGYAIKIKSAEYHLNESFTATDPAVGPQTWTLNLRNIKNYCYALIIVIRPANSVQPASLSPNLDLHNYIVPSEYWLEDGGSEITKHFYGIGSTGQSTITHNDWGLNVAGTLAYPDLAVGMRIAILPFTHNDWNMHTTVESDNHSYGGRFMIRYNNLQLKLNFYQNHPQLVNTTQYFLNVYGLIHNSLFFIRGDFRKFLL